QLREARLPQLVHGAEKPGDEGNALLAGAVLFQQEVAEALFEAIDCIQRGTTQKVALQLGLLLGLKRSPRSAPVFDQEPVEGVGPDKYDETASAMIAQLKYGSGIPFYRLESLEDQ